MANLVVPDESKIPKEGLLLGDIEVTVTDCDGNQVQVHGLTANDLIVRTLQGDTIPLPEYVIRYAGVVPDLTNSTITTSDGSIVTLLEVAESLDEVQFQVADLQDKYENL